MRKSFPNVPVLISEKQRVEAARKKRHQQVLDELHQEEAHTRMQFLLIKLGKALGYDVVVAANDRGKSFGDDRFSFHCLPALPVLNVCEDVAATIDLIDVLWFEKGTSRVACGFEVEKSTSIYSGLLRLADLALALPDHGIKMFLVAPDDREREVLAQLKRPSLLASNLGAATYILFSDLDKYCESMCRFGCGRDVLEKIARVTPEVNNHR